MAMTNLINFFLRLAQTIFSLSAIVFILARPESDRYSVFRYFVGLMFMVISWSIAVAVTDGFAVFLGLPLRPRGIQWIVTLGDLVLALLSLAAACAATAVITYLPELKGSHCLGCKLSVIMAFFTWICLASSGLLNAWLLASRYI
ncbi:hypothetical protein MKW92_032062 [Papaver armeniacum]|nr:hypothetical protein MKW92_032062 [Papaver armeniacum]